MPSVAQSVGLALVRRGAGVVYERHRPETTTLYEVVRDNLETLYGAVDEGALPIGLPAFVRRELDGYPRERQLEKPVARITYVTSRLGPEPHQISSGDSRVCEVYRAGRNCTSRVLWGCAMG